MNLLEGEIFAFISLSLMIYDLQTVHLSNIIIYFKKEFAEKISEALIEAEVMYCFDKCCPLVLIDLFTANGSRNHELF